MAAGARERDELLDAGRRLDQLGLGRPAPPHRHDDDVAVAGEQPREVRRDRGLADPLAGADHGDRRARRSPRRRAGRSGSRRRCRRARPRARARPSGSGRPGRAPARRRGRRRPRRRRSRRRAARRSRRPPAASRCRPTRIAPTHSYGSSSERAPDDVGRVLAVDQGHRPHRRRRHLVLDPRGVLLVLERLEVELDDPLLPVERVAPPDGDVRAVDLDDVVTGARVASEAERRDGAGVDDEEVLEPPRIRNVLVPGEDEVHTRRAAGTRSRRRRRRRRSARARCRAPEAGGGAGRRRAAAPGSANSCSIQRVAAAADLAVVEVGLGRVDRDDGDAVLAQHRVALRRRAPRSGRSRRCASRGSPGSRRTTRSRAGRGSASPGRTPP